MQKVIFKSTYTYSANILRSVLLKLLKRLLGDAKILRMTLKKASKVFCKTTDIGVMIYIQEEIK